MVSNYKNVFSITVLNSFYPLSKSLNEYLSNKMVFNYYKKGEYLLKKGEICDRIHIIRKGLVIGLYSFNNKEISTWVGVDGEFATSITGIYKKEPAQVGILCLEDTYTESLTYDEIVYALNLYNDMVMLQIELLKHYLLVAEKRVMITKIPSAKSRYDYFRKHYDPEIVERLPKKYLASLLNMRPETLSRLVLSPIQNIM
jgi:CRP/FNR family transcriptional regulator, anaerobic regulatory protein